MPNAKRKTKPATAELPPVLRPFTTCYPGFWNGHCKSYESAVESVVRRLVRDGVGNATIEDPTKERKDAVLARIRKTREGFTVWCPHLKALTYIPAPRNNVTKGRLVRVK